VGTKKDVIREHWKVVPKKKEKALKNLLGKKEENQKGEEGVARGGGYADGQRS